MKTFVTGATGFVGRRVVRKLRARGDEVVALVRTPSKAGALTELGCELVAGDLHATEAIRHAVKGCDSIFHIAAVYKIGVPRDECADMYASNVHGTRTVIEAGLAAGVPRIVYVSTVGAFGNTRGVIVDETYSRPDENFLSCYDETKYLAHRQAERSIASGASIVIVQPGGVYGPGDHSELGGQIKQAAAGKLMFKVFADLGFNFVYVEDAAEGIVLAHDKGRVGESYVIGGEITTMGAVIDKVCEIAGHKPPRVTLPTWFIKLAVPVGPLVGKVMGQPRNVGEIVKTSEGVTFWASDAKARAELGYSPRGLDRGLRETVDGATRSS